jgi:quercetin dioxygenase-like cupin family protein
MATTDAMAVIGARLRALRLSRGLTLKQAAERARLSRSFVSMVESGTTEIALSRLIRLADAYGVLITELLLDVHEREIELTRASDAYVFPTGTDGVSIEYLASPSWTMQPFRVIVAPGARTEPLRHAGEEFVHCLQGRVTLDVAGRPHVLEPGDTLYLPGGVDHAYVNDGAETGVVVGGTRRPAPPNGAAGP